MPGLIVVSGRDAEAVRDRAEAALFRADMPTRARAVFPDGAVTVIGGTAQTLLHQAHDLVLAFEGYLYDTGLTGPALGDWLAARWRRLQTDCCTDLDGSFRLMVWAGDTSYVFNDPMGSRPQFVAPVPEGVMVAPEAAPLLQRQASVTPDGANLVHFLLCGRFFAGESPVQTIRQIPPGSYLALRGGRAAVHGYTRYDLAPTDNWDEAAVKEALGARLDASIAAARARIARPVIVLTGGYDSRFIARGLATLPHAADVEAVLWGEEPELPGGDIAQAEAEAARLGMPFRVLPYRLDIPRWFHRLVRAQSGMSDTAFTHVDELPLCAMLARSGCDGMFRGDEVFGANGGPVATHDDVLRRLGWFYGEGADWLSDILNLDVAAAVAAHRHKLTALLAEAGDDAATRRDVLYVRERMPALLHHLGAQRAHFFETVNPLISRDVVALWRQVSEPRRTDKQLFRDLFHDRYGREGFAYASNAFRWARLQAEESPLAAFMQREIEQLPALFQRDRVRALFARRGRDAAPGVVGLGDDGRVHASPVRVIARVLTAACWFREEGPMYQNGCWEEDL